MNYKSASQPAASKMNTYAYLFNVPITGLKYNVYTLVGSKEPRHISQKMHSELMILYYNEH